MLKGESHNFSHTSIQIQFLFTIKQGDSQKYLLYLTLDNFK